MTALTTRTGQRNRPYVWLPTLIVVLTVVAMVFLARGFYSFQANVLATTGESLALAASAIAETVQRRTHRCQGCGFPTKGPQNDDGAACVFEEDLPCLSVVRCNRLHRSNHRGHRRSQRRTRSERERLVSIRPQTKRDLCSGCPSIQGVEGDLSRGVLGAHSRPRR